MEAQAPPYNARHVPLYPRYQVVGRDPIDTSAWSHSLDVVRRRQSADALQEPVDRTMPFTSAPAPTSRAPDTVDATNGHFATNPNRWTLQQPTAFVRRPPQVPGKKRQRCLGDVERRSIIQRIDNGETQADLAREFGVTRAAICHMKKYRDEIVSRYELLVASAETLQRKKDKGVSAVQELTQTSVKLLLTTLRDVTTSHAMFRASSKRLMGLLLEEALASAGSAADTVATTSGQTVRGLKPLARAVCCVAVGDKGWPFVQLYRRVEPHGFIGRIDLRSTRNGPIVDCLHLPRDLPVGARFLLLSASTASGESLCASLRALQEHGVAVEHIQIAVLVCTSGVVDRVTTEVPGVRIITCAIEAVAPATTLSDFLDRYGATQRKTDASREAPLCRQLESSSVFQR